MEVTIASCRSNSFYSTERRKHTVEFKKDVILRARHHFYKSANSHYGKAKTRGQEELVIQDCDKEASHTKRASGKEVSIS